MIPIDTTKIRDNKTAIQALKKLGFERQKMSMTRGAKTFMHPDIERFQISLSAHGYIATGGGWTHISMATQISNLAVGASEKLLTQIARLRELGVLDDTPVTLWVFAVALAQGALATGRKKEVEA